MKILFDHPNPFLLRHGGLQIQIEQTMAGLQRLGLDVEFLRWWDDRQTGDIIHYFGRPLRHYVSAAQQKGKRVVLADLFGGLGARPAAVRVVQRAIMRLAWRALPEDFTFRLGWESYAMADACIAITPWEAHLMVEMFSAPQTKVHFVPNGVESVFLDSLATHRGPWLVCTANICAQKRILELAEAAVAAQTPVWIIGKPFTEADAYVQAFLELARRHPKWIRYEGPIQDRARLATAYREARGFALLSQYGSLSLSALEAAACGCPLLLGDLPWARSMFADRVQYCSTTASIRKTAAVLGRFYQEAPGIQPPPRPKSWLEVAQQLAVIYEAACQTSR
jgi:glycosyltransferase involved in cell wall biosynthesis